MRELARRELQRHSEFRVITVSDGVSAVRSAEQLQPDLIVLDIGLPGLDGLSAARQIRQLSPTSRIVFLTQESSPDIVDEALELGAYGYLHKMQATFLLPTVEAILNGASIGADRAHRAQFVSDDETLLTMAERFLAAAMGDGRAAVAIASRTHRAQLVDGLTRLGVNLHKDRCLLENKVEEEAS